MATIDSLDLAALQNNPQSIAEALEDVLETTDGTIGQLKTDAQSKKDDIDDLYDLALTAKQSIDTLLSSVGSIQSKHYTSGYETNWVDENQTAGTSDENGILIKRWGKLYVLHISMRKSPAPTLDSWDKIMTIDSNDIDLPSNTVYLGHQTGKYFGHEDYLANMQLNTSGHLNIMPYRNVESTYYVIGTFVGLDG